MTDEQEIRELIATWHRASAAGDVSQTLPLMAEDVVFLVAGHPPMRGRDTFAEGFKNVIQQFRMTSQYEIKEIQTSGTLGYCWTHLSVTMTPLAGGPPRQRTGYTLTIFRKEQDGRWVLARDANLLQAVDPGSTP